MSTNKEFQRQATFGDERVNKVPDRKIEAEIEKLTVEQTAIIPSDERKRMFINEPELQKCIN